MLPRALRLHPNLLKKRLPQQTRYVFPLEMKVYVFPTFQNKWFVRVPKTTTSLASERNRIRRLVHEAIIKVSQNETPLCYEIVVAKSTPNVTAPQIYNSVIKLVQMLKQP